jgi:hypothetical protein
MLKLSGSGKKTASFEIPFSIFDIPSGSTASLLFSNYRPQKNWLNNCFIKAIEKRKWDSVMTVRGCAKGIAGAGLSVIGKRRIP